MPAPGLRGQSPGPAPAGRVRPCNPAVARSSNLPVASPEPLRMSRPTALLRGPGFAPGFTLLELLVVIGVLSVLLGLSVGFLGRTSPEAIAASILAGETRAAQLTARAEGVPTEVWVRPGRDGAPGTVQARLLDPVVSFHLEPTDSVLDDSLRPTLLGEPVANGRFGAGRQNREGERGPVLAWPLGPAKVSLSEGFVVRLDVKFERRTTATILRIPPLVEFVVDDELRPRGRFRLQGASGDTLLATMGSEVPLPVMSWCTIEIASDGKSAWIAQNGVEIARTKIEGTLQSDKDLALEVSPGESPIPGTIDEVRVFVFTLAPAQFLPTELRPERAFRFAFDARGDAIEKPVVTWATAEAP